MIDLDKQFAADIDALAAAAVEGVSVALDRKLDAAQASIALALFWSRAAVVQGEWITIKRDGVSLGLALEPVFEKGFIAHAARVIGRGRQLKLVAA